ncbi:amino acid adenylation domain-containing protein (plasmid) [Cylindrospermum sp. NIES-4074]|nr:amino acid adenylation domain-containing protein [Cylindrospermum sp. NIES-4074]
MKTINEFMSELRSKDVKVWSQGDRLRYKAPEETLTPTLLQELKKRKTEILEFLHRGNTAAFKLPPILPALQDNDLPLSFAQQRLWFLNQLEPDSTVYNMPTAYRLTGTLNVTALEQSLNQIWQRHSILRATFASIDGQPKQAILKGINLTLPLIDLQPIPEANREIQAQRLTTIEAQQPFDLVKGPLFRAKLLRLTTTEHVLLLTMHHIVNDGWSYSIFFRELAALYTAFSAGEDLSLSELSIQYTDFAVWQRQCLQGEVLQSQLDYWKQQLGGKLPILQLPTNYTRPAVQTYRGTYQSLQLSLELTQALKVLSEKEKVTLFMTLLTVFKVLLYRYSGQEDIVVGTPIAGRNREETEQLIGLFVNSLALQTNLGQNPTFKELLSQVREVTLGAYSHQDFPLEKLIEELQPERDTNRSPLFQMMFVFQNTPNDSWELPGLTITSIEVHTGTAKLDLTLDLEETSEGIRGGIEYNTDLFDSTTIMRMLGHFQTLLESIVTNPQQHISNLPLLTATEQHQLLVEWNNTQNHYPKDTCIHRLFEEQVAKNPDAVAVIFENQQLAYQQLNHRANQLAHYLISLGVKPEATVGICVERSLYLIVAIFAILKAGAAYVPLDPAYPQERLAFMLTDAAVPVLLTQKHLLDKLPSHQAKVICLDTDWEAISQEKSCNPITEVKPSNLAYILYTSGSTGQPKGVAIEHQNTVNFIHWAQTTFTSQQLAGVLASTSICFDLSVFELFVPLSGGGQVILAENALHLPTLKAAKDVTLINTVPSAIAELIRVNAIPPSVRTVNLAGEPLSPQLINQLYQHPSIQQVYNLYGPTEATTYSTFSLCSTHSDNQRVSNSSIGRPIANTQIYILDSHLYPVPIGVPGELYIGGAGLARGYFNRPELTQEKFIANPFSNEPSERLYKTGDLARYLSNGDIEFLGRLDNQVKIRGFRIELEEIEAAIAQHPSVQQTVVTARVGDAGDKRLVAYIVPHSEQTCTEQGRSTPTTDQLRHFLKQKLPEYMVPSAFVVLDTLPLTPNGKIDRNALPDPNSVRPNLEETFVAPRTTIEQQIADIWTPLLKLEKVGIHDNFFTLGGHSLLATQVIARLRASFGIDFPVRTLFEAPTVALLAERIETFQWVTEQPQMDIMSNYEEGEL